MKVAADPPQLQVLMRHLEDQLDGAEGLIDRLPGAKGPHPNRVWEEVEKAILDHAP